LRFAESSRTGSLVIVAALVSTVLLAQTPAPQIRRSKPGPGDDKVIRLLPAGTSGQRAEATPRAGFVNVRGVRLHYVDWGGSGEALVFLTANGGRPERQFDALAPNFVDRFHVMGLTRRGQGESEKPPSGYDLDSLARDCAGFLDVMRIDRAHLAGHSVAGAEMTHFAVKYPHRVRKLVYLDAANDYAQLNKISAEANFAPNSDRALTAILDGASKSPPEYAKVKAAALDIAVAYDAPWPLPPDATDAYRRYTKIVFDTDYPGDQVRKFQAQMKHGEVVRLRNTDHVAFLHDPAQLKIVVAEMRRFLLRP
jgi:pimeloyl-ACP methyl ester carboxylesterase